MSKRDSYCGVKTGKERKLNIYSVLIKSSLLYGSETWRLTENNKRRVEATEMDVLRRSSRISRKERIRNVTIRQQIGLEETIVKEIQFTSHGYVQRMAEGRLHKIALKWTPKQKRHIYDPVLSSLKMEGKRLLNFFGLSCLILNLNVLISI
jgi:hypothetical protein